MFITGNTSKERVQSLKDNKIFITESIDEVYGSENKVGIMEEMLFMVNQSDYISLDISITETIDESSERWESIKRVKEEGNVDLGEVNRERQQRCLGSKWN